MARKGYKKVQALCGAVTAVVFLLPVLSVLKSGVIRARGSRSQVQIAPDATL